MASQEQPRHERNHALSIAELSAAQDALFESADALADFMEGGGDVVTDWTPGQVRMCSQFIALRSAVDAIQEAAHRASITRMISAYYETEDD